MSGDTLKSTTEAYWGKLGKLPSVDAIFRACEELEQESLPVNRDTVKERSGVTFNNLLADGMKLYRRRQDELAEFTHTPTSVLHVIAQAVDREFAALQAHYESQLATWQADTAILHGDLIQELELLRLCNTRLESDLHEKNAQLEAQIEEQHSLRVELKAHEKALSERDSQYHAALGEGESLRQALVVEKQSQLAMARDHQSQLASLKEEQRQQRQELIEQHDKETARLQAQLGKERGEWKLARAELEEALHATREENATLKAELQERRGESSQQRQLLAERDQRIKDLKLQVQSAAGLTATIEQQARQIQHQEQEIARLREKTDTEATDRITKLLDRIGTLQQVRGNEES